MVDKTLDKKPAPLPPIKQYYTVKVEIMAPVTLTYIVLADDPQQALERAYSAPLSRLPEIHFSRMKRLKASIYLKGTNLLQFIKNL